MRNIVEHGQISGSSDTIVLSGVSSSSRLTRWISVPTPMTDPVGCLLDGPDDEVGRADLVGQLADLVARTRGGRRRCRRGARPGRRRRARAGSAGGPSSGPSRAGRWRSLRSASVRPPRSQAGVPHAHVVVRVAHGQAGVAAEVLVGEEQHLRRRRRRPRPGPERPLQHGAGVGRRAHRAAVAADEGLQRGRRVHVRDRHDGRDVDRRRPAPPTPPRPSRCRPCRPSSSRR